MDHCQLFQYISCYSLSSDRAHACIINPGFNTSHVTLYRGRRGRCRIVNEFQYISCYSLSALQKHYQGLIQEFQYISCYSLSVVQALPEQMQWRFNTSHVTLYLCAGIAGGNARMFQYISCYSLSLVFPIFSLLTFFIISQNTRVCNIFPKQHRLFESFHRSTPKPYIFTTFHIFL